METTRELAGSRTQTVRHFRARIRMDRQVHPVHSGPIGGSAGPSGGSHIDREAIYQAYFHGPSFQVLNKVTAASDGSVAGWMQPGLENPPLGRPGGLLTAPMLTELAFQAAGVLEMRAHRRMGLPAGVENLRIHPCPPGDRGRIAAWVIPEKGGKDPRYQVKVLDERGFLLLELDGYRTSPLPAPLDGALYRKLLEGKAQA
jgi:hypothetical protein